MSDAQITQINMSRIPVAGIGGLGMVAAAGATAYFLPEARAFTLVGVIGGVLIAFALIVIRSRRGLGPSKGPTLPLQGAPAGDRLEPTRNALPPGTRRARIAWGVLH
jgi:hypothetical protein